MPTQPESENPWKSQKVEDLSLEHQSSKRFTDLGAGTEVTAEVLARQAHLEITVGKGLPTSYLHLLDPAPAPASPPDKQTGYLKGTVQGYPPPDTEECFGVGYQ